MIMYGEFKRYPGFNNSPMLLAIVLFSLLAAANTERQVITTFSTIRQYEYLLKDQGYLTPLQIHFIQTKSHHDMPAPFSHLNQPIKVRKEELLKSRRWLEGLLKEINYKSKGILRDTSGHSFFKRLPGYQESFNESPHRCLAAEYFMLITCYASSPSVSSGIRTVKDVFEKEDVTLAEEKLNAIREAWREFWVLDHCYSALYIHLLAFFLACVQHEIYLRSEGNVDSLNAQIEYLWIKFDADLSEFYPRIANATKKVLTLPVNSSIFYVRGLIYVHACHVFSVPVSNATHQTFTVLLVDPKNGRTIDGLNDFELQQTNVLRAAHLVVYVSQLSERQRDTLKSILLALFRLNSPISTQVITQAIDAVIAPNAT